MQAFKTFRGYFLRGLAALLPTVVTIWIFVQCYVFVQDNISIHINRGVVRLAIATADWYPPITDDDKVTYVLKKISVVSLPVQSVPPFVEVHSLPLA